MAGKAWHVAYDEAIGSYPDTLIRKEMHLMFAFRTKFQPEHLPP